MEEQISYGVEVSVSYSGSYITAFREVQADSPKDAVEKAIKLFPEFKKEEL